MEPLGTSLGLWEILGAYTLGLVKGGAWDVNHFTDAQFLAIQNKFQCLSSIQPSYPPSMAKPSTRKLWAMKLAGNLPTATAPGTTSPRGGKRLDGIILGIDPSLRGTGLAVLEVRSGKRSLLNSHTVRMKTKATMPECLAGIYKAVSSVIEDYQVDLVALEQTIYVQNFQTAQILGAARGAAIAAAAVMERPVFEYPPLRVKQAVVGYGRASKHQVAQTVKQLLSLGDALGFDEADAAGVALCHAFTG